MTNTEPGQKPDKLALAVRVRVTRWDGTVETYKQGLLVGHPINADIGPGGVPSYALDVRQTSTLDGLAIEIVEGGTGLPVASAYVLVDHPINPVCDQVDINLNCHPVNLESQPLPPPQ